MIILVIGATFVVGSTLLTFLPKQAAAVLNPEVPFINIDGKPIEASFFLGIIGIVILGIGLLTVLVRGR